MPRAEMATGVEAGARREAPGHLFRFCQARRNQPTLSNWAFKARGFLAIWLVALAVLGPSLGKAAGVAEPTPAANTALTNFDGLVHLALRQSPFFTKSALEIELKHLDESDSRYGMIPPLSFQTLYYLTQPGHNASSQPYTLQFVTSPYNPFESYFSLQARKLLTQTAILTHLQVIVDGLQRLGKMFLELDTLNRVAAWQTELVSLARQNLAYEENRLRSGSSTSLEVRVAAQEAELAQVEKDRITAAQAKALAGLKSFLGLKSPQELSLDLQEARRQVLGQFDPAAATLDQARTRSYEVKIVEIRKQLQAYNITMAKTKLLPSLLMGVQTPDPLSSTQSGMYFYMGLNVPVWDGFSRLRNISRQKAILRQYAAEAEMKESDLNGKWQQAQEDLRSTAAAWKVAQAQEELARLKERQSEIRHQSGGEPLPVLIEGRKGRLEAQKSTALKSMDHDLSILGLRHLSGDLGASYVEASSWQK